MAERSPLPWSIRPHQYDDWGFVRGADGHIACIARGEGIDTHDAHRSAGTDPYQANAELIVKAVNSHAPLVKALTDALCELSHCADQLGAREENSVRRAIAEARRLLTAVGGSPRG